MQGKVTLPDGCEWPRRKDMPTPKTRGGDVEKLQRESCQVDDTVILENLIKLSRDHGIEVTIKTLQGDVYIGKLLADVSFNAATVGVPALYIRRVIEGNEKHAVIPVSSIDSLTFVAEKGFLDNLVE